MNKEKKSVVDFWDKASCGELLYLNDKTLEGFNNEQKIRYKLEPYIIPFAAFDEFKDKRVLEIGVGLGSDHQMFSEYGAKLWGIDLSKRAVKNTKTRFANLGLKSNLTVGDAEKMKFDSNFFDLVYSWGVIHHSPDTVNAINEIYRVLKPGGIAKIMIYHKWSFVGYMLWIRYALFRLKPWLTLDYIYKYYLESPGTKAYSKSNAKELFSNFSEVSIKTVLTHADLLIGDVGITKEDIMLKLAKKIWPRSIIKALFKKHGLFMMIQAKKI